MKFSALGFIVLTFLSSCGDKPLVTKPYFNIDSLVDAQIVLLTRVHASVHKTAMIDNVNDEGDFTPDSLLWVHELEVFRDLDRINRPIFENAYTLMDGKKDTQSNLTIRSYIAKTKVPISEIHFYYHNSFKKLKKIEALLEEDNSLYYSKRKLTLELDEFDSTNGLTLYTLQGIQKMVLSDTVRFSISSKVVY